MLDGISPNYIYQSTYDASKDREIKKELDRAFGKYEFVEDGHYYLCNGKRVGISTTGLIH